MNVLEFHGIDGSNPLGMLAALGVLRVGGLEGSKCRMAWGMANRPFPILETALSLDQLASAIVAEGRRVAQQVASPKYGDVISIPVDQFRNLAGSACRQINAAAVPSDSDFYAAWASDAVCDASGGKVRYCAFSFSNGASGQKLLANYRDLADQCTAGDTKANLQELNAVMTSENQTHLNWDPASARSHAYRWFDPEKTKLDPKRTNIPLNVLAFLGLSLLPAMPVGRSLASVGMGADHEAWTWPIWKPFLNLPCVKALLNTPRDTLPAEALWAVYRSRRNKVGSGTNVRLYFTPAVRVP